MEIRQAISGPKDYKDMKSREPWWKNGPEPPMQRFVPDETQGIYSGLGYFNEIGIILYEKTLFRSDTIINPIIVIISKAVTKPSKRILHCRSGQHSGNQDQKTPV